MARKAASSGASSRPACFSPAISDSASGIPGSALTQRDSSFGVAAAGGAHAPTRVDMNLPGTLQAGEFLRRDDGGGFTAEPFQTLVVFVVELAYWLLTRLGAADRRFVRRFLRGRKGVLIVRHDCFSSFSSSRMPVICIRSSSDSECASAGLPQTKQCGLRSTVAQTAE